MLGSLSCESSTFICNDAYVGVNACGGGNDDDDVGGVEGERNAVVALPLPSRCIDASAMPDIFNIDDECQLMNH